MAKLEKNNILFFKAKCWLAKLARGVTSFGPFGRLAKLARGEKRKKVKQALDHSVKDAGSWERGQPSRSFPPFTLSLIHK